MDHTWFGVNDHTVVELPPEVMQFGGALSHILWLLRHADPDEGPVYMAKSDISDGFYRLFLDPDDAPKLAVLMPKYKGEPQLVTVPLSLTIGWVSSPPTFCTASETAADIANTSLFCHTMPPHHLEDAASTHDCWGLPPHPDLGPQPPFSLLTIEPVSALVLPSPQPEDHAPQLALPILELAELAPPLSQPEDHVLLMKHRGPITHVDVFVNDFIGLAQGSCRHCKIIPCCIMHAVDDIFSQPDLTTAQRKEAVLVKKLLKGEGGWSQRKEVLGWILDTYRGMLELTDQHKARILAIFKDLHHKG